jgi:hypothetical protein
MPVPQFERKLYADDSPELRFVKRICSIAGTLALEIGHRVEREAIKAVRGEWVDLNDVRGLMIGFHFKAIDQVLGGRAALSKGALGVALASCRVLFETLVLQSYLLRTDTVSRVAEYRARGVAESLKDARGRILGGDSSEDAMIRLFRLAAAHAGSQAQQMRRRSLEELAREVGLANLYVYLYRMVSQILHSRDADTYNPLMFVSMAYANRFEEPSFKTDYTYWPLSDILGVAGFLDAAPLAIAHNTASFLGLPMDDGEKWIMKVSHDALFSPEVQTVDEISNAWMRMTRAND